jgi:hypothetical protein
MTSTMKRSLGNATGGEVWDWDDAPSDLPKSAP